MKESEIIKLVEESNASTIVKSTIIKYIKVAFKEGLREGFDEGMKAATEIWGKVTTNMIIKK